MHLAFLAAALTAANGDFFTDDYYPITLHKPCPPLGIQPAHGYFWLFWEKRHGRPAPPPPMPPADGKDETPGEARAPRPETSALVVIQAPVDAIITFNGVRMPRTGPREAYRTPNMEPGSSAAYDVAVTVERDGLPTRAARRITVEPGRRTELDFRSLGPGRPLGPGPKRPIP